MIKARLLREIKSALDAAKSYSQELSDLLKGVRDTGLMSNVTMGKMRIAQNHWVEQMARHKKATARYNCAELFPC